MLHYTKVIKVYIQNVTSLQQGILHLDTGMWVSDHVRSTRSNENIVFYLMATKRKTRTVISFIAYYWSVPVKFQALSSTQGNMREIMSVNVCISLEKYIIHSFNQSLGSLLGLEFTLINQCPYTKMTYKYYDNHCTVVVSPQFEDL